MLEYYNEKDNNNKNDEEELFRKKLKSWEVKIRIEDHL